MPPFAVRGTIAQATTFGSVELLSDRVVVVESKQLGGKILAIAESAQANALLLEHGVAERVLHLKVLRKHLDRKLLIAHYYITFFGLRFKL